MAESAYVESLLAQFRLPTIRQSLPEVTELARRESWDYLRFLQELCEREHQVRHERRIGRLLRQCGLPEGKTLASLDQSKLAPSVRKQMVALLDGGFVGKSTNVLAFGLPGRGKTHCLCAIARELILKHQMSVWFTPAFKLVQVLLRAKEQLRLDEQLKRLARFELIIIDDIGYVQHDRSEMEVLFNFFAERYERGSLMITSNLPFSKWDKIFHDPMTAMAAIDRLVHHSIILEFTGESQRMAAAENPNP
jgi:DNA replication protein DnaC